MLFLLSIVELLMAGFNDSIIRFLKDKIPLADKQCIVLFALYYKYFLIFSLIPIVYGAKQYGFFEFLIGNHDEVSYVVDSFLLVTILNDLLSALIGVNNCILNAEHKYKLTANIGFVRNLACLFIVITLSFYTQDYLDYLYSSIAVSVVVLIFLSIKVGKDLSEFFILSLIRDKFSIDIGKISVLLDTKKWGDYFDIGTLITNKSLLVKRPEALNDHIFSRIENEQSLDTIKLINDKFFVTIRMGRNGL